MKNIAIFCMLAVTVCFGAASAAFVQDRSIDSPNGVEIEGTNNLTANLSDGAGFSSSSWSVNISDGNGSVAVWAVWNPADSDVFNEGAYGGMPAGTTVADIERISYYTKDGDVSDTTDWYLQIFTYGEDGGWYGSCLSAEPGNIDVVGQQDNVWQLWDTAAETDTLTFYDHSDPDYNGSWPGSFSDQLGLNNELETQFGDEEVLGIYLKVGDSKANNWAHTGSISALQIELEDGTVMQTNFVPEPATMALLGLGGLMLRRKRRA